MNNYLLPEKQALNILKNNKYFVKIPKIYIYSDAEKQMLGIPIDEKDSKINKKSLMEIVDSYKSIYDIITICSEDNTVYITDDNDILDILRKSNEALNLLKQSNSQKEIIFNLELLINKILEENKEYIDILYKKEQKTKESEFTKTFNNLQNFKKNTDRDIVTNISPINIRKISIMD